MSNHFSRSLGAAVAMAAVAICCQTASAAEVVRINGTGGGLVVMRSLISVFQKANPGVSFEMEESIGSAASLKALARDMLDIAVSGRPLKPHEMSEKLAWSEYGKIPYAVVTNRHTKIENMTVDQLAAMYAGTLTTWPDGDFVRVVLRPKEDADTKELRAISPLMDRAVSAAHARKDMLLGITDREAFGHLKRTRGTVGFIALAMPASEPGAVNVSRLNGVEPSLSNLASREYLYAKRIFVVTSKESSPSVKKFLNFINSPKGRAIAVKSGLLPTSK